MVSADILKQAFALQHPAERLAQIAREMGTTTNDLRARAKLAAEQRPPQTEAQRIAAQVATIARENGMSPNDPRAQAIYQAQQRQTVAGYVAPKAQVPVYGSGGVVVGHDAPSPPVKPTAYGTPAGVIPPGQVIRDHPSASAQEKKPHYPSQLETDSLAHWAKEDEIGRTLGATTKAGWAAITALRENFRKDHAGQEPLLGIRTSGKYAYQAPTDSAGNRIVRGPSLPATKPRLDAAGNVQLPAATAPVPPISAPTYNPGEVAPTVAGKPSAVGVPSASAIDYAKEAVAAGITTPLQAEYGYSSPSSYTDSYAYAEDAPPEKTKLNPLIYIGAAALLLGVL